VLASPAELELTALQAKAFVATARLETTIILHIFQRAQIVQAVHTTLSQAEDLFMSMEICSFLASIVQLGLTLLQANPSAQFALLEHTTHLLAAPLLPHALLVQLERTILSQEVPHQALASHAQLELLVLPAKPPASARLEHTILRLEACPQLSVILVLLVLIVYLEASPSSHASFVMLELTTRRLAATPQAHAWHARLVLTIH
jgi:hypothetical protein